MQYCKYMQCIAAISSLIYAIVKLWTVTEFMHETHYFSHFEIMFRLCTNFLVLHFMNFRFTVIVFFFTCASLPVNATRCCIYRGIAFGSYM